MGNRRRKASHTSPPSHARKRKASKSSAAAAPVPKVTAPADGSARAEHHSNTESIAKRVTQPRGRNGNVLDNPEKNNDQHQTEQKEIAKINLDSNCSDAHVVAVAPLEVKPVAAQPATTVKRVENMNSVPYDFCTRVISSFRSIVDTDFGKGVWKEAYETAQAKRRVYEFFLRPGKNYGCWEYLFAGSTFPTFEEIASSDCRYVHINHVVIYGNQAIQKYKKWHQLSEENAIYLVEQVGNQILHKIEFECHLDNIMENFKVAEAVFKHICEPNVFKNIHLTYCTEMSQQFLAKQIENGEIWELCLRGDWPISAQQLLVNFMKTHFWHICLNHTNLEMDKTLFAVIHDRWSKGMCNSFKVLQCIDKIGEDQWRAFFPDQEGNEDGSMRNFVVMEGDESRGIRPLRVNFESHGRVTIWSL